jgi:hypothetical protein
MAQLKVIEKVLSTRVETAGGVPWGGMDEPPKSSASGGQQQDRRGRETRPKVLRPPVPRSFATVHDPRGLYAPIAPGE